MFQKNILYLVYFLQERKKEKITRLNFHNDIPRNTKNI